MWFIFASSFGTVSLFCSGTTSGLLKVQNKIYDITFSRQKRKKNGGKGFDNLALKLQSILFLETFQIFLLIYVTVRIHNFCFKLIDFLSFFLLLRKLGTRKNYAKHLNITVNSFKVNCHNVTFLSELQREMCAIHHNILNTVGRGVRLSIEECQFQFKMNRWNCSTYDDEQARVFGPVLDISNWFSIVFTRIFYLPFAQFCCR